MDTLPPPSRLTDPPEASERLVAPLVPSEPNSRPPAIVFPETAPASTKATADSDGKSRTGGVQTGLLVALGVTLIIGAFAGLVALGSDDDNTLSQAPLATQPASTTAAVDEAGALPLAEQTAPAAVEPAETIAPATTAAVVSSSTVAAPAPVAVDGDASETATSPVTSVADAVVVPEPAPAATEAAVDAPTTVPPVLNVADSTPSDPNVEESRAVVRNGQIFLEGAVPTIEAGNAIELLAAEVIGPQNVFNNYVVDPGAGDPSVGNITVEDTINFATNSSALQQTASSETLLNQGLALMTIRPSVTITIVGHTDSRGTAATNLTLSQARAESVKAWFVERGVDPSRLTAVGLGDTEPLATNDTPAGQTENRRIQFFLENLFADA